MFYTMTFQGLNLIYLNRLHVLFILFFMGSLFKLSAQYEGGSGRQEALSSTSVLQLNDGTAAATTSLVFTTGVSDMFEISQNLNTLTLEYRTANGQRAYFETGNVALTFQTNPGSATLNGTTTQAPNNGVATFTGLSVSALGSGYQLLASGASSTSATSTAFTVYSVNAGGSGRQDAMADGVDGVSTLSGQVFWIGGGGSSPTAWNDPLNWFPNTAVPGATARLAMEPNNNGHNPILDQNRTVFSFNFNGASKKAVLGNFNLTLTGTVAGANANNFFQSNGTGTLKRSITNATSFTFPLGNANYNPVTIVNNNLASDVFSVKVRDEVLVDGTSGGQVADPHVNATWDISKTNANTGSGVDFVFQWESSQERNSIANFSLNHHNGTDWDFAVNTSNSVTGSTTKIMNHYGYTGTFSPFAIGYQNTPLPLELLYFNAECKPQGVTALSWATASEINSAYFELQSSDDMLHWTILKTIPALGFHSSTYQYPEVLDSKPSQTTRYYRLKQVDLDGEYRYFQTLAAYCPLSGTTISLYPNPTAEHLHIQGAQAGVSWEIIDMTGRRILNGTITERPLQSISILGLPAGIYRLKLPTISLPLIIQ
jgi:hypothetical protein